MHYVLYNTVGEYTMYVELSHKALKAFEKKSELFLLREAET